MAIQEFLELAEYQDIPVSLVTLELWGNPVTQVHQEFRVTQELKDCRVIVEFMESQDILAYRVFRAILEFQEPPVTLESLESLDILVSKAFRAILDPMGQAGILVFLASQGSLVIRVSRD